MEQYITENNYLEILIEEVDLDQVRIYFKIMIIQDLVEIEFIKEISRIVNRT